MTSSIVEHWDDIIEQEFSGDFQDLYFSERYFNLGLEEGGVSRCFVYRDGTSTFLLPYISRPLPSIYGVGRYDIQSPYGYGGPISNCSEPNFLQSAFNEFKSVMKRNGIVVGFLRLHPILNNRCLLPDDVTYFDRHTVSVNTSLSVEDLWQKEIHSKNRNMIRKAINSNFRYEVDKDLSKLDQFVDLYKLTMNRLNADRFYFFDDDYFKKLKDFKSNGIFLGLIYQESELAAAAIFFESKNYGHYHLSASDERFRHLAPSNLLLYSAALGFQSKGKKEFHLGGGRTRDSDDDLLKFKEKFSKSKRDFFISKILFDSEEYNRICSTWEQTHPEKKELYSNFFLKYRM